MKLKKKRLFNPKLVKMEIETKDVKEKERKSTKGHFYGKKWYPN